MAVSAQHNALLLCFFQGFLEHTRPQQPMNFNVVGVANDVVEVERSGVVLPAVDATQSTFI